MLHETPDAADGTLAAPAPGAGQVAGGSAPGGDGGKAGGLAAGEPTTPRIKRIRASKNKPRPGVYSVKEYPITEDTLDRIGTLRTSVAFWSAVGSLGLGFVLSTWQSLSLAGDGAKQEAISAWWAYVKAGAFITLVSYAAAIYYHCKGKSVLQFVKDNTTHDEE